MNEAERHDAKQSLPMPDPRSDPLNLPALFRWVLPFSVEVRTRSIDTQMASPAAVWIHVGHLHHTGLDLQRACTFHAQKQMNCTMFM